MSVQLILFAALAFCAMVAVRVWLLKREAHDVVQIRRHPNHIWIWVCGECLHRDVADTEADCYINAYVHSRMVHGRDLGTPERH